VLTTTDTPTRPVPALPLYEGLFLEPVVAPYDGTDDDDEEDER
jgi:hypothetical protein